MDGRTSSALSTPAVKGTLQFCGRAYPAPNRTEADLLLEPWRCTPAHGDLQTALARTDKRKRPRLRLESWDARSNSPPPKTALPQANRLCGHEEWLQRATGRWTGQHDGRSVFIGCPPDATMQPEPTPFVPSASPPPASKSSQIAPGRFCSC